MEGCILSEDLNLMSLIEAALVNNAQSLLINWVFGRAGVRIGVNYADVLSFRTSSWPNILAQKFPINFAIVLLLIR